MTLRCSIDGCTHETTKYDSFWICSKHWQRHCPPRSTRRRAYHRYFRLAKKHGWHWKGVDGRSARLDWHFRKFWALLLKLANAAEARDAFEAAEVHKINTMFGWNDD